MIDQYQADKGKYPASLEALVERRLPAHDPEGPDDAARRTGRRCRPSPTPTTPAPSPAIYDVKSASAATSLAGDPVQRMVKDRRRRAAIVRRLWPWRWRPGRGLARRPRARSPARGRAPRAAPAAGAAELPRIDLARLDATRRGDRTAGAARRRSSSARRPRRRRPPTAAPAPPPPASAARRRRTRPSRTPPPVPPLSVKYIGAVETRGA